MPLRLLAPLIDLVLEYEQTEVRMVGEINGLCILATGDNRVLCFPKSATGVPRIRTMGRLPFCPAIISPHGVWSDDGRRYEFSGVVAQKGDTEQDLILRPDPIEDWFIGWCETDVTDGVSSPAGEVVLPAKNIVSIADFKDHPSRTFLCAILSRYPGGDLLTSTRDLEVINTRMPEDRFVFVTASGDTVYALTTTGQLYTLPIEETRTASPGWSIRPIGPVRKIISVPYQRRGLDCLALLHDGTLWRLDPEGNERMPTFSSPSRPADALADDIMACGNGYAVLRHKRFMVEVVPHR